MAARAPRGATCSAPGKVLLSGGYLVLQEGLAGLVVSSSARFAARAFWARGADFGAAPAGASDALRAALRGAAAAELSPRVRVNVIAPSLTDTPLAARFTGTEAVKKALGDAHPIPRLGSADEVAALAEFLIDDATAGWITGQVFSVDGGRSTLRPKN